jgi:hypothetical protein
VKALYLESSAALSWLLAEPVGEEVLEKIGSFDAVVSSVLTAVEIERSLARFERKGSLLPSQRQRLSAVFRRAADSWLLLDVTPPVRERAGNPFPVEPVRTLDALHLATALEFLNLYDHLMVLSYDQRILANLPALGLPAA